MSTGWPQAGTEVGKAQKGFCFFFLPLLEDLDGAGAVVAPMQLGVDTRWVCLLVWVLSGYLGSLLLAVVSHCCLVVPSFWFCPGVMHDALEQNLL
jgi:hypothetical protein